MKNLFLLINLFVFPLFSFAQEVNGNSSNVNNAAVKGTHTAQNGRGVYGESFNGFGVWGFSQSQTGVHGESRDGNGVSGISQKGAGVYGESAQFNAVRGIGKNRNHGAVVGIHESGGFGVYGESASGGAVVGKSKTWMGVFGESEQFEGVRGQAKSRDHGGVVGIGVNVGVYGKTDDPNGAAVWADGKMMAKVVEILGGSDIAEHFKVSEINKPVAEAGTVMVMDAKNEGQVMPSTDAYDKKVVGVVSGAGGVNTGMTLRQEGTLEGDALLAVAGRVYVKVTNVNGNIKPGDLLTTAPVEGHAMKATNKKKSTGSIIGKALTSSNAKDGLVLMLVNIQ